MQSPLTIPPTPKYYLKNYKVKFLLIFIALPKLAPICGQYASRTNVFLESVDRKTTKFSPMQSTCLAVPGLISFEVANLYQPFGKGGNSLVPIFRSFRARFTANFLSLASFLKGQKAKRILSGN